MIRDLTIEDVKEKLSRNRLISIQTKGDQEKRLEVNFQKMKLLYIVKHNGIIVCRSMTDIWAVHKYNSIKL